MRVVADSSCDLFTLNIHDFNTVPLTIYTAERSFTDDSSLNIKEMLDYLAEYKGRSYTSCPSSEAWKQAFEGADEIFVMTVTSALSGSCSSAESAAREYKEEHPNTKISILDSLSTGAEEALLLFKLAEYIKAGDSFEDIDKNIRAYMQKTRLFFSFFSLHNLSQNGRVNKTVASALRMLNIAVTGTATSEGTIQVTGKARGNKKVIRTVLEDAEKAGYTGGKAVITHVENEELAEQLKNAVLQVFPNADITILPVRGLCAYYMERKGIVFSCETN